MKIYRIGGIGVPSVMGSVPSVMGSVSIPRNHIRLYHYTNGKAEDIKAQGLLISKARGSTYGEPNMIWGSTLKPDVGKNVVEFHIAIDDSAIDRWLDYPKREEERNDLEGWMNSGNHHMGIHRDIGIGEIIAIHEPWHIPYRHIVEDNELMGRVRGGEFDYLMNGKTPEEGRAIEEIKKFGRTAGVSYESISNSDMEEYDSDKIGAAQDVFNESEIYPNRNKEISDIALSDGTVIGVTASEWGRGEGGEGDKGDEDTAIFSFDIAVKPQFRNMMVGPRLIERAINSYAIDKRAWEDMGYKTLMRLDIVNMRLPGYMTRQYGFKIEDVFIGRMIMIKE